MFFDATAWAMAGGQAAEQNPIMGLMPLIVMFAIFYFLLIRPQQKKAKLHREMLSNLKKGDRVLTAGGIYGRITEVSGDVLTIEIGKDLKIDVNRAYVAGQDAPGKTPEVVKKDEK